MMVFFIVVAPGINDFVNIDSTILVDIVLSNVIASPLSSFFLTNILIVFQIELLQLFLINGSVTVFIHQVEFFVNVVDVIIIATFMITFIRVIFFIIVSAPSNGDFIEIDSTISILVVVLDIVMSPSSCFFFSDVFISFQVELLQLLFINVSIFIMIHMGEFFFDVVNIISSARTKDVLTFFIVMFFFSIMAESVNNFVSRNEVIVIKINGFNGIVGPFTSFLLRQIFIKEHEEVFQFMTINLAIFICINVAESLFDVIQVILSAVTFNKFTTFIMIIIVITEAPGFNDFINSDNTITIMIFVGDVYMSPFLSFFLANFEFINVESGQLIKVNGSITILINVIKSFFNIVDITFRAVSILFTTFFMMFTTFVMFIMMMAITPRSNNLIDRDSTVAVKIMILDIVMSPCGGFFFSDIFNDIQVELL
mmetsp:Transcript_16282/g.13938  ORF Transcript_16282/g.13938 Transcript_16282/m.13938 type:complete len:425 (+) Transcript_16282:200-1474(+)